MISATLFEVEEKPIELTCRSCEHRERHQCGGSIIQYCGIRKSNRTQNGQLKIKVTMAACSQYKKFEPTKNKQP
jgi:hypothetical protein